MKKIFCIYILALLVLSSLQQYNMDDIDYSQFMDNSILQDQFNCFNHEDASTCSSVQMKSGILQCCTYKIEVWHYFGDSGQYKKLEQPEDMCLAWASEMTDEQIKIFERSYQEVTTFLNLFYSYNLPRMKYTYTCPKKTYTFSYSEGSFTEEEKAIMKDKDYCLRLYYEGLHAFDGIFPFMIDSDRTITKDICMNGKTLPNSGNTCAYASFNLKLLNGKTEKIATCTLVNSAHYETKSLDESLKEDFEKIKSFKGEYVQSFDVEITDKNGDILKYDSLTQTVTATQINASGKLEISLLILFSFLLLLL